jgi:hypothetical protein
VGSPILDIGRRGAGERSAPAVDPVLIHLLFVALVVPTAGISGGR